MTLPTPPVMPGLPVLGNALEFSRNPEGLIARGYQQLGPVFAIRLAGRYAAVFIGPDNAKTFFDQTDKALSMPEVYSFLIPMFGDKLFFVAGQEEYKEQRAMMLPAFSVRKFGGYVEVMAEETQRWMDGLGESGEFELVSSVERLAMYIIAHAFMGRDFRNQLGEEFRLLYGDLAGGIEFLLPTNLPLPRFWRRDRARQRLTALVENIIEERRRSPGQYQDFLQTFLDSTYSDGSLPPQNIITSMIMGLVFAGHETTAGHAAWGLIQLLQHPDYLARVVQESQQVLGQERQVSMEKLKQLSYLEWALKETERTHPVTTMLMRYVRHSFDACGYTIPEGWLAMVSPPVSHRLPELFENPDTWDPERFKPGREEDRKHTLALIGFGGGLHKCLGMNFAYTEMKVIFSLLLSQYQLELTRPDPKPGKRPGVSRPETPLMIRYKKL